MTLFYSEELRLLLEICIMLLKAKRTSIPIKELNSICETHFNKSQVSVLLIKEKLAISNNISIELIFPQWYYEEMIQEIDRNKFVQSLRWDNEKDKEGIWLPFYCEAEIEKEVKENKTLYKGLQIQNKTISGIGDKAICLEDEKGEKIYHWFILPKYMLFKKNTRGDGYELAKEIIKKYGEKNNHLKYITGEV